MGAIHVLSTRIAELIAAGEVIDRPASIVKELVENSLDARAGRISVEIKNGGVTYLRVTDDGSGIGKGDIPTAFIRHATSKIASENDLEAIDTLGFRGEALPSVAAVSHVKLTTRTADDLLGYCYEIDALTAGEVLETGCPVGTTIEVSDLFYNTPARMKFLKKDAAEGNAVASVIENLALANPGVSFEFIREGKRVLFTAGDGELLSVIRAIWGSEAASSMISADIRRDGIAVTGYISKPSLSRATRSNQAFFINTRFIRFKTCFAAVEEAYKNRLQTGRHPSCVLNLSINPALVDVNVHPAKTEVRFSSEREVFNSIYAACSAALEKDDELPVAADTKHITPFSISDFDHSVRQVKLPEAEPLRWQESSAPLVMRDTTGDTVPPALLTRKSSFPAMDRTDYTGFSLKKTSIDIEVDESFPRGPNIFDTSTKQPAPPVEDAPIERVSFRVLGEIFELYILIEHKNELLLIDKHAAHERYIYDRLRLLEIAGERQQLLTPQSVVLSREEYSALLDNTEALEKLGITVEDFGQCTLLVREIPMLLERVSITQILSEIAARLINSNYDITPPAIDKMLYSISCRAAVMGGKSSSPLELEALAEVILNEEKIRYCPHGRPAVVSMKKHEIERLFGRIR